MGIALVVLLFIWFFRRNRAQYIVVDGSNVMHWRDESPSLETVRHVLLELTRLGYVPVVWFDANVGYKISNRYLRPQALAKLLNVPQRQVFIAPKGTPADPLLLDYAKKMQANVVTNDQFRDWTDAYPWIKDPGFLIPGRVQGAAQGTQVVLEGVGIAAALMQVTDKPVSVAATRRQRRADKERAKALSARRMLWSLLGLPFVASAIALSVYIRTSPYEPEKAILHLAARVSCDAARMVGLAPSYRGELGYHARNDADGDGVACEVVFANSQPIGPVPVRRSAPRDRMVGGAKFVKP